MRKYLLLIVTTGLLYQFTARAQWDLSSVQSVDNTCSLSDVQIDDSKLSIQMRGFQLGEPDLRTVNDSSELECKTQVSFLLPAHHKMDTFTHRVIARAAKDEHVEIRMRIAVDFAFSQFKISGILPFGTRFDDRVLLYRSFNARSLVECSESQQRLTFDLIWNLELNKRDLAKVGYISMEGDGARADTWLSIAKCASLGTLTR